MKTRRPAQLRHGPFGGKQPCCEAVEVCIGIPANDASHQPMTLIATYACLNSVMQVSDRLMSVNGRAADPESNKSILLFARNAILSFAYTGPAFVRRADSADWRPMDEWIVEQLIDERVEMGPDGVTPAEYWRNSPLRNLTKDVGQLLSCLANQIDAACRSGAIHAQAPFPLTILAVGWQWRSAVERAQPVLYSVHKPSLEKSTVCSESFRGIGNGLILNCSPRGYLVSGELDQAAEEVAKAKRTDDALELLAMLIRRVAKRHPQTIGTDLLSIEMLPPRTSRVIRVRYLGNPNTTRYMRNAHLLYSPWIVASKCVVPPTLIFNHRYFDTSGWRVDFGIPAIRAMRDGSLLAGLTQHTRRLPSSK